MCEEWCLWHAEGQLHTVFAFFLVSFSVITLFFFHPKGIKMMIEQISNS